MSRRKSHKLSNRAQSILITGLFAGMVTGFGVVAYTQETSAVQIHSAGEVVEREGYKVTLNSSRIEHIEEPYNKTNLSYVVVDMSIENTSDQPLSFIPVFQSFVRTYGGQTFDMSPIPAEIDPIYAGDIEPGTSVSGELSYFVPDADQQLLFFFDPGWNESKAIFASID